LIDVAAEMQSRSLSFDAALADLASLLLQIALAMSVPDALDADLPELERIQGFAQRFAADDVQLYYQIAVQGRQDLPLAPDEHSGFVMTLLRMLAFRPEGTVVSPAGSLAMPEKKTAQASPPAARPAQSSEPIQRADMPFGGDWADLVRELKLGGAAKLLADNSELKRHDGNQFELSIPKTMAYLADKGYADKLKAALAQRFGGMITLRVAVGDVEGKSVAALEQGERTARQAKAADAVRGDPFVRDLVDIFDATVIDNSIHATPKGS
jgi:DNA polymerase-3 subunit gamma/tau